MSKNFLTPLSRSQFAPPIDNFFAAPEIRRAGNTWQYGFVEKATKGVLRFASANNVPRKQSSLG